MGGTGTPGKEKGNNQDSRYEEEIGISGSDHTGMFLPEYIKVLA
jgi:hypothetical protein